SNAGVMKRAKAVPWQNFTDKLFIRGIVATLVPKRDSTYRRYATGSVFALLDCIECRSFLLSSFPVQRLGTWSVASSNCQFCLDSELFTPRIVTAPAHELSPTSFTIKSLAAKPLTPATAGKLLSPCCP